MENGDSGHVIPPEEAPELSSPRKSSPPPDHEEKTYLKFLLSNAEAGSIIGKGGSTINEFQSQSGARIQLSRNFEFFPGTSDRIVMVSGSVDVVLKAVDLIISKLTDEFYTDGGEAEPRSRARLVVPNMCCGGIIGKEGVIIKSFIEDSRASIKISPPDQMYPGLRDRLVSLIGTQGEQMRAIELILVKLSEDPNYIQSINTPFPYPGVGFNGANYAGPNGVGGKFLNGRFPNKEEKNSSLTIGVADEHIGLVVGRGGRSLTEITQVSGARIKISDRGDFLSGTSDRKVTISGPQGAIRVAEAMITQKVVSASER